jgi:hypothetical protein
MKDAGNSTPFFNEVESYLVLSKPESIRRMWTGSGKKAEKRVFQGDGGAEAQIFGNLANHRHKRVGPYPKPVLDRASPKPVGEP